MTLDTVLIVGAGPTGLTLAISLARNGIPFRIIDKKQQYTLGQRGSTIQPRTLEVYNLLGFLPDFLAASRPPLPIVFYEPDGVTVKTLVNSAHLVKDTPSNPYINPRSIGQDKHEEVLRAQLTKAGYEVELGIELLRFEQFPDHVVAHIVNAQGEESTIKVGWLVGTDGARGVVRRQLGLPFVGVSRTENIVVGDIHIKNSPLDVTKWHMWGNVATKMISLRPYASGADDRYYTVAAGKSLDRETTAASRESYINEFKAITGRNDIKFGDLITMTHFTINIRMVDKFGQGRVFVAGDAAHIHSPAGGQGLNTGVQDASNLAWKLAHVIKHLSPPSLLDSYTSERRPVVAAMLSETTKLLEQAVKQAAGDAQGAAFESAWELRQFGVNYRGSEIVLDQNQGEKETDPYRSGDDGTVRAGDRAPDAPGLIKDDATRTSVFRLLDPTRHTVLLFGELRLEDNFKYPAVEVVRVYPQGSTTKELGGSVVDGDGHAYRGYVVAEGADEAVIVRPDGVIGARVSDVEGVKRYFGKVLLQTR